MIRNVKNKTNLIQNKTNFIQNKTNFIQLQWQLWKLGCMIFFVWHWKRKPNSSQGQIILG